MIILQQSKVRRDTKTRNSKPKTTSLRVTYLNRKYLDLEKRCNILRVVI